MAEEHDGITQEELPEFVEQVSDSPASSGGEAATSGGGGGGLEAVSWSQLWQVPSLLAGIGVFALGLYLIVPRHAPPDYHSVLDEADALIRTESAPELERAVERLDTVQADFEVYPPDNTVRGRYWQYSGDANYLDLMLSHDRPASTEVTEKNRRRILEYYDKAVSFGRELDDRALRWKALTFVALGEPDEALRLVDALDPLRPEHRYAIVRDLIEREAARAEPDPGTLERLLDRFRREIAREQDSEERLDQRVWAVGFKADQYLDVNDPQRAIDYLNVETQRLRSEGRFDVPELLVRLAEAHRRAGSFEESKRLFLQAQRMVPAGHELGAPIVIGLADIELAHGGEGYLERAQALYRQAEKQYPASDLVIDALIGQANIETQIGQHGDAVNHYREGVKRLVEQAPVWDERRAEVIDQVATHVERAREQDRFADALDLLAVATPLHGEVLPVPIVQRFAEVHESIAEQRMADGDALDPLTWAGAGDPPVEARRLAYQEAAMHFGRSAEYFLRHARRVVEFDDAQHGGSLWKAARNFDRAQLWTEAINTYDEFLATRAVDGQHLQAQHQLAAAYQADRQYGPAIQLFENLIEEHGNSRWAYASLVPLARSYTAVDRPADAIQTLLRVLQNHPAVTPDSDTYRDALVDLARTYYIMGDDEPSMYVNAIVRLEEAAERYGDTRQGPELHYMLADSMRRSVEELDRKLALSIPQRQRRELETERDERLLQAQEHFATARAALEARHELALSPLEKLYRRNAWFYEADCPFRRGDYVTAIDRYREAAERWQGDPASLVAWVQIVNAYCELEEYAAARAANNKALLLLERMDDDAFDRPEVPMTRRHWQDWLRWTSELDLFERQAASAN